LIVPSHIVVVLDLSYLHQVMTELADGFWWFWHVCLPRRLTKARHWIKVDGSVPMALLSISRLEEAWVLDPTRLDFPRLVCNRTALGR